MARTSIMHAALHVVKYFPRFVMGSLLLHSARSGESLGIFRQLYNCSGTVRKLLGDICTSRWCGGSVQSPLVHGSKVRIMPLDLILNAGHLFSCQLASLPIVGTSADIISGLVKTLVKKEEGEENKQEMVNYRWKWAHICNMQRRGNVVLWYVRTYNPHNTPWIIF